MSTYENTASIFQLAFGLNAALQELPLSKRLHNPDNIPQSNIPQSRYPRSINCKIGEDQRDFVGNIRMAR
jgi:hypothetical protein